MYQIQFAGYQPIRYSEPDESPLEHIQDADEAWDIIQSALMSDPDAAGWHHGEAGGEDFQVRNLA